MSPTAESCPKSHLFLNSHKPDTSIDCHRPRVHSPETPPHTISHLKPILRNLSPNSPTSWTRQAPGAWAPMHGQTGLLDSNQPVGKAQSCLERVSTLPSHLAGWAQGAHRGEDVSIEAFDGHWPAPISRVWWPRPGRSPGTSGGSPRRSLFPPFLLAIFLLPNPHQLHASALPADDHCGGMGREGAQRTVRLVSLEPFLSHPTCGSRLPDSSCP